MKYFIPLDLIVALWVISASIDLVVVLMEKISVSMDLVVVLWKILFHGLGCRPMESFCSMDLVVVLRRVSVPWT
jgi:hypothetical protein